MQRLLILAVLTIGLLAAKAPGQEPGWWGVVIAPEPIRPQIQSTPIIHRPYRPLHFYGNTIRRQYYRGTVLPAPRDLLEGSGALIIRR